MNPRQHAVAAINAVNVLVGNERAVALEAVEREITLAVQEKRELADRLREDQILVAWQRTIERGTRVRHRAEPEEVGVVLGVSAHPVYDLDVSFEKEISPCYKRNLLPEWWPIQKPVAR